jgi:hypothetical protein
MSGHASDDEEAPAAAAVTAGPLTTFQSVWKGSGEICDGATETLPFATELVGAELGFACDVVETMSVVDWELALELGVALLLELPSWMVWVTVTVTIDPWSDWELGALLDCWGAEDTGVWVGAAGAVCDPTDIEKFPDAGGEEGFDRGTGGAPLTTKAAVGLTKMAWSSCNLIAAELIGWFALKLPFFGTEFEVMLISIHVV